MKLRHLWCNFFHSDTRVVQRLSENAGLFECNTCKCRWAYNADMRAVLPWTDEFKAFYEKRGVEIQP